MNVVGPALALTRTPTAGPRGGRFAGPWDQSGRPTVGHAGHPTQWPAVRSAALRRYAPNGASSLVHSLNSWTQRDRRAGALTAGSRRSSANQHTQTFSYTTPPAPGHVTDAASGPPPDLTGGHISAVATDPAAGCPR